MAKDIAQQNISLAAIESIVAVSISTIASTENAFIFLEITPLILMDTISSIAAENVMKAGRQFLINTLFTITKLITLL